MCCQIITLIFGILALVKGEFSLTRTRVVGGTPARIIGMILILPLPLSFGLALVGGMFVAVHGGDIDDKTLQVAANALSAGVLLLCLGTAIGIAIFTARPINKKPSKFDDGLDDLPPDPEPNQPKPSEPDPHFRAR